MKLKLIELKLETRLTDFISLLNSILYAGHRKLALQSIWIYIITTNMFLLQILDLSVIWIISLDLGNKLYSV